MNLSSISGPRPGCSLRAFALATALLLAALIATPPACAADKPLAPWDQWRDDLDKAQSKGDERRMKEAADRLTAIRQAKAAFKSRIEATVSSDNDRAHESLLNDELKFDAATFGRDSSQWRETRDELAGFFESRDRFKEAEPLRADALAWLLGFKDPPADGMALMFARLKLADEMEHQGRWKDATPIREASVKDVGENRRNIKRPVAELAVNLLEQQRWQEAEPYLREVGDRPGLAKALEGLNRWPEAEGLWRESPRSPGNLARLEANLRHQGKNAQATDVAEQVFAAQRPAPPAVPSSVPSPEEAAKAAGQRMIIQRLRDQAAEFQAKGQPEQAARMNSMADVMEASIDRSPEGVKRSQEAAKRMGIENLRRMAEQAERAGHTAEAANYRAQLRMIDAETAAPTPVGWAGKPPVGLAQAQAQLAVKQAAVGRLDDAEKGLSGACPALRDGALVDVPTPRGIDLRAKDAMTASQCFAELALVRGQRALKAGSAVDGVAFASAQHATLTEAGAALSRSAARSYAQRSGLGPVIEQIDMHLVAMNGPVEQFFTTYPPARIPEFMQGGPANAEKSAAFMQDLAAMATANRPHAIAVDDLVKQLQARLPRYFEFRSPDPVSLADLQSTVGDSAKLLNEDEALVLWMTVPGARRGLVFAITKDRAAWAEIGLSGDEIAARVTRLRSQIDPCTFGNAQASCDPGVLRFDRQAAFELHQALLGAPDIQAVIAPEAIKTLMIVPSGPLTSLPPGLLVTAPPGPDATADSSPEILATTRWLIQRKALSVLPSVSSLRTLRVYPRQMTNADTGSVVKASPDDRLFMMADPDFSGSNASADKDADERCEQAYRSVPRPAAGYFQQTRVDRRAVARLPRLPCTRLEGLALKQMLGGTVLMGGDARESALRTSANRDHLARAEIVAFATHGLVSGDMGLGEPALVLAAPLASETGDDGILTASKITGLKLSADWVVLSACNTASPDARDANGLSGLSRAFFFAGAKGLLVSHWRVDDLASGALVQRAVQLRRSGISKAAALRQASLDMMNGKVGPPDEAWLQRARHPASWAAFTLIGEPR